MLDKKFAIIGGGNLGSSVAEGLLKSGLVKPGNLVITQVQDKIHTNKSLAEKGIKVISDNKKAVADADVVFLAVKPYLFEGIISEISHSFTKDKILGSFVTGVTLAQLKESVFTKLSTFRIMPNTAISVQESMTCISVDELATEDDKELIQKIFNKLGEAIFIDEKMMGAATVLASCGTAFALRYLRASMQAGIDMGFPADVAKQMVAQTVKGACEIALTHPTHLEQEIDKVTTPGGITIAGLNAMEHEGFSSAVIQGTLKAFARVNGK